MWHKSYSVIAKNITKEQIWTVLSDVQNWVKWDPQIRKIETKGPFKEGGYFYLYPLNGPRVKIKLKRVIANRHFTDCTNFPFAKMYGIHDIEELDTNTLKLTTSILIKGPLSYLWRKIIAEKIAKDIPEEMKSQIEMARAIQI